ncbi:MAG: hypothetical protein DRR19_04510 [Candidatus Parabeggiatoa sp. nov. 1]|nr:MAG: hypothetical protein DRR19_04510 [Gammaproteobacteria bacterium]
MIKVESLKYDTIFKKAFRPKDIFTGLVEDFTGVHLEIDEVENDKVFTPPIGKVKVHFDLFAEDKKNRVIVEAQHATNKMPLVGYLDRFFYYHAAALIEMIHSSQNYRFPKIVLTLVFFTEKKSPKPDHNILVQDSEIRTLKGEVVDIVGGFKHKVIFVFTTDPLADLEVPKPCLEWIEAINDTLDGDIFDETNYENPLIQRLFETISVEKTTSKEKAKMKVELKQEEIDQILLENCREIAANLKQQGKLTEDEIANVVNLPLEEVQALD